MLTIYLSWPILDVKVNRNLIVNILKTESCYISPLGCPFSSTVHMITKLAVPVDLPRLCTTPVVELFLSIMPLTAEEHSVQGPHMASEQRSTASRRASVRMYACVISKHQVS